VYLEIVDDKYLNNDFNIGSGGDNIGIGIDGFVKYTRKYSSKSLTNITRNIVRLIIRIVLKRQI
jgi:hypothetical protein